MKDKEKKREVEKEGVGAQGKEKLSRREAMKRMAKGIALVGTLGVTAVITQGQDECSGGYINLVPPGYYNYSDAYYNYADTYSNYNNAYYNTYSNIYSDTYTNYTDYYNYYDHGYSNSSYYNW